MAHRATTRPEMTDATAVIVAIGETDDDPAPPDARIATAMSTHMRPAAATGIVSARTVTEEEEAEVLVVVGTATAETGNGTATGVADGTVATMVAAALRDATGTCLTTAEATDATEAIEATGVTVATGATEATGVAATETRTFSHRIAVAAAPRRPRKESPLPISPMSSRCWSASAA